VDIGSSAAAFDGFSSVLNVTVSALIVANGTAGGSGIKSGASPAGAVDVNRDIAMNSARIDILSDKTSQRNLSKFVHAGPGASGSVGKIEERKAI
jgi:hypothetical protein